MAEKIIVTPSRTLKLKGEWDNLRILKESYKEGKLFRKKSYTVWRIYIDEKEIGYSKVTYGLHTAISFEEAQDVYADVQEQLGVQPRNIIPKVKRVMENINAMLVSKDKEERQLAELLHLFKRGVSRDHDSK